MTFKKYLDSVLSETELISEYCGDRFIENHSCFGLEDPEIVGGEIILFGLYGDGDSHALIDINQEVSFDGVYVNVVDNNKNKLSLQFYKLTLLPHPIV